MISGGIIIIILLLVGLLRNIRIVPQSEAYVIERLGAFNAVWGVGFHVKIPFIDSIALKVSLKEITKNFAPQSVITKDNINMTVDSVVYYQITDPRLYCYGIADPVRAIENITATTLRNIMGELELDNTLTSRDTINTRLRASLDEVTDAWGVKVVRVEIKDIEPDKIIKDAMALQASAERERRAAIAKAEGEKQSAVLKAQGAAEAMGLEADAKKNWTVKQAEGQADSIAVVQRAIAEGVKLINESAPTPEAIKLKSLETLEKVAQGQATKIIIPSDLQGVAGFASVFAEVSAKEKQVEVRQVQDIEITD